MRYGLVARDADAAAHTVCGADDGCVCDRRHGWHYNIRNLQSIRFTMYRIRVRFQPADFDRRITAGFVSAGGPMPAC